MNPHDALWFGFMLFTVGAVFGVAAARALRDVTNQVERDKHQLTVIEQGKEIARLRAQVALHIGKEK